MKFKSSLNLKTFFIQI